MKEDILKKIQVLANKVQLEGIKKEERKFDKKTVQSNSPNSLADNIKTEQQANTFMTLLKAL